MPLNDGAINQILPFCPNGAESDSPFDDLLDLATYQTIIERIRGHQPGIAKRGVENRALRQALHVASGVAQFVANRYAPGVVDDTDLDKVEAGLVQAVESIVEAYGILPWDPAIPYTLPILVWGSDNNVYQAMLPSLNQNPITDDGTYWYKIGTIKDIKEISKDQCLLHASGNITVPEGITAIRAALDVVTLDEFHPTGWDNTLYQFTVPRNGMYAFKVIGNATPVSTDAGLNVYTYRKVGAANPELIGHTQIIMQRGYITPIVGLTIQNLDPNDVVYFELIAGHAATVSNMSAIICQI